MAYVYLFTSNYGEYHKDVLDILALPNGLKHRFRYDLKHVSPTLRGSRDLSKLVGLQGVVALKNLDEQTAGYKTLPLREVKITNVSLFEDTFVHFEFVLLNFPHITDEVLAQFSDFVQKKIIKDAFVQKSEEQFSFQYGTSQMENWRSFVTRLEKLEKFESSIFIKLYAIFDEERKTKASISTNAYQLKGGRSYRLEFLHLYPEALFSTVQQQAREVFSKLFFSREVISPILDEQSIEGRYDLNRHYFYCFRNLRSISSVLVLGGSSDRNVYFPSINIPVVIKRSWTRESVLLLVLGAGMFLGGILEIVLKGIAKAQQLGISVSFSNAPAILANGWRESGVLAPILMILGLILTLIRNLPST